jgi:hypothetical protein
MEKENKTQENFKEDLNRRSFIAKTSMAAIGAVGAAGLISS